MQMQNNKSVLTHKLNAQVICCFRWQEGETEGEKKTQVSFRVVHKSSLSQHIIRLSHKLLHLCHICCHKEPAFVLHKK